MPSKEKLNTRFNLITTESQREFIEKQAEKLGISASEFIRDLIDVDRERRMNHELEMAAAALADEYRNNAELGQLTAIDEDPFL